MMLGLVLLLFALILVAPVVAIVALVRVQRLERRGGTADRERIAALERQLHALSREVAALRGGAATEPPAPPLPQGPPAVVAPRATPQPRAPQSVAPPRPPRDLEALIGGRWLNRVGIVTLLLAAAFFLKWAFDNQWIGPRGRVSIGLLAGAGLVAASGRLRRRGYPYFSEGIAGLGAGVLYLSLYAAWHFYALVGGAVAFAGMAAVTATLGAIAVGRDSQRLAVLALSGGLMTPGILSTGQDAQVTLFSYLALLVAAVVAIVGRRDWRALSPLALAGTLMYFGAWHGRFYTPERLAATLGFAALFFVEFAAPAALRARRRLALRGDDVALALVNLGALLLLLQRTLWSEMRWGLTLAVLVLAAAHLALAFGLPRDAAGRAQGRMFFAGLALTLATLAVPVRLEGRWIPVAWSIEVAVLAWSGLRAASRPLRGAALVLGALVAGLLVVWPEAAGAGAAPRFLFNARFATFAVAIAAFGAAFALARRAVPPLGDAERRGFDALGVAANALAVLALSREAWDLGGRTIPAGVDPDLGRQLALSLVWAVYATALVVVGARFASPGVRWQGLALLGAVVFKAFLFDLSFLERGFRILSFCVLGVALLLVSFLYQRRSAGGSASGSS